MTWGIIQESLDELWELRDRHRAAVSQLVTNGRTAVSRALAFIVSQYGYFWEKTAPWLTGTLASATRERVFNNEGRVFIDPTIENPVTGGFAAVYGPVVHDTRNPWVTRLYYDQTEQILRDGADLLWDALDEIYSQANPAPSL